LRRSIGSRTRYLLGSPITLNRFVEALFTAEGPALPTNRLMQAIELAAATNHPLGALKMAEGKLRRFFDPGLAHTKQAIDFGGLVLRRERP
jgi:hypothetical protein